MRDTPIWLQRYNFYMKFPQKMALFFLQTSESQDFSKKNAMRMAKNLTHGNF